MRAVAEQVDQAAANRRHVLVAGEPGTDRERVARAIHRRSATGPGPFVKVACTSHSPEALELELFGYRTSGGGGSGHERRALERIAREGLLHQALGGTIFFEQLAVLPARVQAKLARALRDGEAVVVQEREAVALDVRVVAAVDEAYDQAVREGRVREDLHRLLSAIRIAVPPLRSRREDIPALARHFVAQFSREAGVTPRTLSESAEQLLAALPLVGNINELKDLSRNIMVKARGPVIELRDVLEVVPLDGRTPSVVLGGTLKDARDRFERDYIRAVLELHHGRVPDAARTLGIQRTNLYRKLRQLKMNAHGSDS